MKPAKYVVMAIEALSLNKARSALTMLGIVIGVLSVIVMVGLGQASQAYITNQVKGLGAGLLIITPGNPKTQMAFGPPGVFTAQTLKMADVRALQALPGVRFVSPNTIMQDLIQAGRDSVSGTVVGANHHMIPLRGYTVAEGRAFNEQEERTGARVVVLSHHLAGELYKHGLAEPVGSKVEIKGRRFRVIGVLADQGAGIFGSNDQALMPTRSLQSLMGGTERINSVMLKAEREDYLPALQDQVTAILRQRHGLAARDEDDFKLQTQEDLLKTVTTITQVFTVLLAGIAAISLLVGGIGIMNIMLVTVTERTREIGVRKALGAKKRDILAQFLVESAAISLAGGLVGMALGLAITWGATHAAQLPFVISPETVVGGMLFSMAVGIAFGLYPANKAAGLQPVDALRYE